MSLSRKSSPFPFAKISEKNRIQHFSSAHPLDKRRSDSDRNDRPVQDKTADHREGLEIFLAETGDALGNAENVVFICPILYGCRPDLGVLAEKNAFAILLQEASVMVDVRDVKST